MAKKEATIASINLKVKLNPIERIVLTGSLPKESDLKTMWIVKDIKEKIKLTQDEIAKFNIKQSNEGVIVEKNDQKREFEFTPLEQNEIKLMLEKLSKEKKVSESHISLFESFDVKE